MHFFSPQSICWKRVCWKKADLKFPLREELYWAEQSVERRKNVFFGLRSSWHQPAAANAWLAASRRREMEKKLKRRKKKNSIWKWHCDQSELLEILSCLANIVCGWQSCHASLWPPASLRIFFRLYKTYNKKKINHALPSRCCKQSRKDIVFHYFEL